MRRKWICRAVVCVLPLVMLAACGDGSEAAMDEKIIATLEPIAVDDDPSSTEEAAEEQVAEIGLQYMT